MTRGFPRADSDPHVLSPTGQRWRKAWTSSACEPAALPFGMSGSARIILESMHQLSSFVRRNRLARKTGESQLASDIFRSAANVASFFFFFFFFSFPGLLTTVSTVVCVWCVSSILSGPSGKMNGNLHLGKMGYYSQRTYLTPQQSTVSPARTAPCRWNWPTNHVPLQHDLFLVHVIRWTETLHVS